MGAFFTEEDFSLFEQYGGKPASDFPEAHERLRRVYDKLGKVVEAVNQYGFNTAIKRNPQNQGQKYETYHWGQIWPKIIPNDPKIIYFVIDCNESGVELHIDAHNRNGHYANQTAFSQSIHDKSWYEIENICTKSLDEIVQETVNYCQSNYIQLLRFGQEFNIAACIKELQKMKTEKMKELLEKNHNLILHGAPGTGKTYRAKEIANMLEAETGFVQFHPSYDYTDFVEGLRPVKSENADTIGFKRMDGIFSLFCQNALKGSEIDGVDNFEESWTSVVEKLNEENYIKIPLLSGKSSFNVELNENGDGLANRTYENEVFDKGNWIKGASKFFNKEQLYNIYKGQKGIPSGGHDNYRKAVIAEMKKTFDLKEYKAGKRADNSKKYVFIIDEINRGDMSKILGELFFCIDPGYRGTKGAIKTQYANMHEAPNSFDEVLNNLPDGEKKEGYGWFFVPENVYIIGTMNDIDRSVESMDFAMRRRFAFQEITAEESMSMLDDIEAWNNNKPADETLNRLKDKMKALNNCIIKKEIGLSNAYQIGAAYFLKFALYQTDEKPFEKLWDNHLGGLLYEYLRGTGDEENKLHVLKNAYDHGTKSTQDN